MRSKQFSPLSFSRLIKCHNFIYLKITLLLPLYYLADFGQENGVPRPRRAVHDESVKMFDMLVRICEDRVGLQRISREVVGFDVVSFCIYL
jgi:hypothetical protein